MKFFLDTNIPYSALEIFEKPNLESQHARDAGLNRAGDAEIMGYAIKTNSILVTKDLGFANVNLFPAESHHGLIVLRFPNSFKAVQFNNSLKNFLESVNLESLKNSTAIVKLGSYRIRKFK